MPLCVMPLDRRSRTDKLGKVDSEAAMYCTPESPRIQITYTSMYFFDICKILLCSLTTDSCTLFYP